LLPYYKPGEYKTPTNGGNDAK